MPLNGWSPSITFMPAAVQANYIDLKHDWNVFFKYEKEYRALATPKGTTIVFGVVYTFRIPKPAPGAPPTP